MPGAEGHLCVVIGGDVAHNRQPQAAAGLGLIKPVEALEHMRSFGILIRR